MGRATACLNDLVTCRYDGWDFFQRPDWQGTLPIHEPLQRWLVAQVAAMDGPSDRVEWRLTTMRPYQNEEDYWRIR